MHTQRRERLAEGECTWVNTRDEQREEDATEAHERDEAEAIGISLAELRDREAQRVGGDR